MISCAWQGLGSVAGGGLRAFHAPTSPAAALYTCGRTADRMRSLDSDSRRRQLLAGWLALTLLAAALHFSPPIALLDLRLVDLEFGMLRRAGPKAAPVSPVLIAADEATLAAFPEPIALWHRYLGDIFSALARAGPQAVGVDIELPERSHDHLQPGMDLLLSRGILAVKSAAPFVVARGVDGLGRVKPVHLPFLALAGDSGSGLATWPLDADGTVRRFDERQNADGSTVPTFAGVLARRLGLAPAPGLLDFGLGPAYSYIPMHEVWNWAQAGDELRMRTEFAGRIVLIGGVFPFVDRHPQAVHLAGWADAGSATPGLLLHAQALRSMLGTGLVAAAPPAWPLVLTLAESVAMQSMTLVLEVLQGTEMRWPVIKRRLKTELGTALLLGLCCGGAVGSVSLLFGGTFGVGLVLLGSIGSAMTIAAGIGATVPVLLHAMKLDPQIAAGPLSLTLTDVLATCIYLVSATLFLTHGA